jgi:predicted  nucleic acid-binding Zn-ribbon protein
MPHKCARCGRIYEDGSVQLISGCDCGSRVFLYLRADYAGSREETIRVLEERELTGPEVDWIDEEFRDRLTREEKTISLDIENVLRVEEGKYRLDLQSLMRGEPIVIKARNGVYYIDIPYAMRKKRK